MEECDRKPNIKLIIIYCFLFFFSFLKEYHIFINHNQSESHSKGQLVCCSSAAGGPFHYS